MAITSFAGIQENAEKLRYRIISVRFALCDGLSRDVCTADRCLPLSLPMPSCRQEYRGHVL